MATKKKVAKKLVKKNVKKQAKKGEKKAKQKSDLHLILDGKVIIEERLGDKIVSSAEIDGNVVLHVLVNAITEGLELMVDKEKK